MNETVPNVPMLPSYRDELERFATRAIVEHWTLPRIVAEISTLPESCADAFTYVLVGLVLEELRRRTDVRAAGPPSAPAGR